MLLIVKSGKLVLSRKVTKASLLKFEVIACDTGGIYCLYSRCTEERLTPVAGEITI